LDDWVDANTVSVNNPLYCCGIVSITIQQIQAAIGLARFQAMARRSTAIAPLAKAAHADQAPRRTAHPVAGVGVDAGSNLPHARTCAGDRG
jgi:hypothetical protein